MLVYILSLIGVSVFAISGALAAGRKDYDWIGVTVVAAVTALGGGTLRDVLLNRPRIFWIEDPMHLWVILASCAATLLLVRFFRAPSRGLLIADALGLALFTISGAQVAEQQGAPIVVVILMGGITGAAGGVMRDILTQETPVLFSPNETLYSLASVFGVVVYLLLKGLNFDQPEASLAGVAAVTAVRFAAIFWNIRLPAFRFHD